MTRGPARPAWQRIPVFRSLSGYQRAWLSSDLVAGLTVWAVLVPEALAYATIAGVSPVVGLYAAMPALVLYAAFGSSRHLVVGPMAATAALSAAAVGDIANRTGANFTQLTAAMALVAGAIALIAGLARLGFLASFISGPVLKGFIIGLALTIIVGQIPKLFGIDKTDGDFFEQAWGIITHLGDTQSWTLLVGVVSLAGVMLLRRFAPKVPGSLVVVLAAIAAVSVFDLDAKGVGIVGPIQSGLPQLGLPDVGLSDYGALVGSAAGLVLIAFAEGLGAAKTYATRDHYRIDVNRELIGLGAANIGSGACSGMVVNGSLSKTAVNGEAGAKSQVSGLLVAGLTILTLLFLTGLFENLPEAALAAVVIAAVVELIDRWALVRLWRSYTAALGSIYGWAARVDLIAALAALFGVLLFDTLPGLFIGIVVSIVLLVYRASRPHVAVLGRRPGEHHWVDLDRNPDATTQPGIVVLRPESGLFYANADNVSADIDNHVDDTTHAVVVDLASVPVIDVSAVDMLVELDEDLTRRGLTLCIARDIGQVSDVLATAGGSALLQRLYPTADDAVAALGRPPSNETGPPDQA
ncbi:MAG: SulP family inorganic anion transporter [Microthrixaceae bacterium]|nr:SulP family inorganic anion transporter [Microthrixaceae bacterium]